MTQRPLLNHVEMVYRPGERDAARALFEAFGFAVSDFGPWLVIAVDAETANGIDNVMYASEPTPAQQNFEAALGDAVTGDARLAETLERFRAVRKVHPQYSFHFGASVPTREDWEARVERLREADRSHPLLAGRVALTVYEPGDPESLGTASQAFVYTDVVTSALFSIGLLFDLQWRPAEALDRASLEGLIAAAAVYDFPDTAAMV